MAKILTHIYVFAGIQYHTIADNFTKRLTGHIVIQGVSGTSSMERAGQDLDNQDLLRSEVIIDFINEGALNDFQFSHDMYNIRQYVNMNKIDYIPILIGDFSKASLKNSLLSEIIDNYNTITIPNYSADSLTIGGARFEEILSDVVYRLNLSEIKENIEVNAPLFITEAEDRLKKRAAELREKAQSYFVGSYVIIFISIIGALWYFLGDADILKHQTDKFIIAFMFLRSLVLLTLITAVVKYSFTLGRAYMHEALKLEERIHAISFGKFYLNVYKEKVKPEEMKEVFRDWNINQGSTAFLEQKTSDFDPKILEKLLDVVKAAKGVVGKD